MFKNYRITELKYVYICEIKNSKHELQVRLDKTEESELKDRSEKKQKLKHEEVGRKVQKKCVTQLGHSKKKNVPLKCVNRTAVRKEREYETEIIYVKIMPKNYLKFVKNFKLYIQEEL